MYRSYKVITIIIFNSTLFFVKFPFPNCCCLSKTGLYHMYQVRVTMSHEIDCNNNILYQNDISHFQRYSTFFCTSLFIRNQKMSKFILRVAQGPVFLGARNYWGGPGDAQNIGFDQPCVYQVIDGTYMN